MERSTGRTDRALALTAAVALAGFALVGYHVAFSGAAWLGLDWQWGDAPLSQGLTAAGLVVLVAIVASAPTADRADTKAVAASAALTSTVVVPLVLGWSHGGGWLSRLATPVVDTTAAGVHVAAGLSGLLLAVAAGSRRRDSRADHATPDDGHTDATAKPATRAELVRPIVLAVVVAGVALAGVTAGLGPDLDLTWTAAAVRLVAAAVVGGVVAGVASWITGHRPTLVMVVPAATGAMVAVGAGLGHLSFGATVIVAVVSGVVVIQSARVVAAAGLDDPVGTITAHLGAGAWGLVAVGLLADPDASTGGGPTGLLYGGSPSLLLTQVAALVAIATLVAALTGAASLVLAGLGLLGGEHQRTSADTPAPADAAAAASPTDGPAEMDEDTEDVRLPVG